MSPLPSLPIETWRQILRHAVYIIPDQLESEWNFPVEQASWRNWEWKEEDLRTSMKIKTSLVLVSREWRDVAVELLYEDIRIRDDQHMKLLIALFDTSKAGGSNKGYGWWTKKVTLPVPRDAQELTHLQFLDRCCNLQTLITIPEGFEDQYPLEPLFNTIQQSLSGSLRRFEIKFRPYRQFLLNIDAKPLAYLRSVQLPVPTLNSPQPEQVFPLVTTLTLHLLASLPTWPGWTFPRLRHLSLFNLGDPDIDALVPFMKQHGSSISSLHFHIPAQCPRISLLLSFTTSLRSLVFGFRDLMAISDPVVSVTHLGLQDDNTPGSMEVLALQRTLESRFFPNLKVVRILDKDVSGVIERAGPGDEEGMGNQGQLVDICLKYQVIPEDRDGKWIRLGNPDQPTR